VTLKEAAVVLGLEPDTLRKQAQRGVLHAERRGRDWWVTPAEVERYRKEHKK